MMFDEPEQIFIDFMHLDASLFCLSSHSRQALWFGCCFVSCFYDPEY